MRLASKFTLALTLCAVSLLVFGGAVQLRNEERDLRNVAVKEALLLARSLQTAFENALRDRQIEDVTETLTALSRVDPTVAIYVFDEEGQLVGSTGSPVTSTETQRVEQTVRKQPTPIVELVPEDEPMLLRVGMRLREEAPSSSSSIVLEKPLDELRRDLRDTRRQIIFTALALALLVTGITLFLSRRYVGRPLRRLVENMRRVRGGDLHLDTTPPSADEVGETQQEFQLLVHELDEARVRADQELEARRRIERGLQHADKLITLGQLSAVLAHEIGSPLQVLEGRARALKKHAADEAATMRTADLLVEQTTRITGIVGQMLAITRRRAPVRLPVDGLTLVRRVAELVELEARRRSVRLEVSADGPVDVVADVDQLQQIALNLLRNALDAAPAGSRISLLVGGDAEGFMLRVIDAGSGLTPEARAHLFEPFFTTKTDSGGSGLGLSVVKALVQEHGGSVEFLEATGCEVRVRLPRRAGDPA